MGPLKAFMQNRILEIKVVLPEANWNYVPTAGNPADLINREICAKKLRSSLVWWHGPKMLPEFEQWDIFPAQLYTVWWDPILYDGILWWDPSSCQWPTDAGGCYCKCVICSRLDEIIWNKNNENGKKEPFWSWLGLDCRGGRWGKRLGFKGLQVESYPQEVNIIRGNDPKECTTLMKQLNLQLREAKEY